MISKVYLSGRGNISQTLIFSKVFVVSCGGFIRIFILDETNSSANGLVYMSDTKRLKQFTQKSLLSILKLDYIKFRCLSRKFTLKTFEDRLKTLNYNILQVIEYDNYKGIQR